MMPFVLVLIAPPGHRVALQAVLEGLAELGDYGWSAPVWLAEGEAVEVGFEVAGPSGADGLRERLRSFHADRPVDLCVVPAHGRRKKLLIADMDSTIIGQECIDEMADLFGLKERIAEITERAMRGELVFEQALRERLALLRGLSETALAQVWRERVTLTPGARTLVATMNRAGARSALVSGGFTFFTSRVADAAGFQQHYGNVLEVIDGHLTGEVIGPVLGREAKLATLERLATESSLSPQETLAVGDGANDLGMIEAAGLGVAYRAKPVVAARAHVAIDHADLTALLYLQGYRREDFVASG